MRHGMDVIDPFYATEQRYYDEIGPKIADLSNRFVSNAKVDCGGRQISRESLAGEQQIPDRGVCRRVYEAVFASWAGQRERLGYTPEDVKRFREQVKRYVVPVSAQLNEGRRKWLGLEKLYPIGCSILMFIQEAGNCCGVQYLFYTLVRLSSFTQKRYGEKKDYFTYCAEKKARQEAEGGSSLKTAMLLVGVACLVLSLLFVFIYYRMS